MQTLADMLKALHANQLPRTVLDDPALKLRVIDGGARRPRRRVPRRRTGRE
jgi:hypothetical protein